MSPYYCHFKTKQALTPNGAEVLTCSTSVVILYQLSEVLELTEYTSRSLTDTFCISLKKSHGTLSHIWLKKNIKKDHQPWFITTLAVIKMVGALQRRMILTSNI